MNRNLEKVKVPERDPRIDPQVGDILYRVGSTHARLRRYITQRDYMWVSYRTDDLTKKVRSVWLHTFQEWAAGSDVEHVEHDPSKKDDAEISTHTGEDLQAK